MSAPQEPPSLGLQPGRCSTLGARGTGRWPWCGAGGVCPAGGLRAERRGMSPGGHYLGLCGSLALGLPGTSGYSWRGRGGGDRRDKGVSRARGRWGPGQGQGQLPGCCCCCSGPSSCPCRSCGACPGRPGGSSLSTACPTGPCRHGPTRITPPARPGRADLVQVVQDLQDGQEAGADEQPHLAPDVACERGGAGVRGSPHGAGEG